MTPEVKKRIEQIRNGNVPDGYLRTPFGCIPSHWRIIKCRDIINEATLGGNYEPSESGVLPLIKMGNIGRGSMSVGKTEYLKNESDADDKDLLKYGDLLFNTRNTMELVGKVAVWHDELPKAYFNSNIMRLTFKPKYVATNEYMNYVFNLGTILSQLRRLATGTTSVAAIYRRDLDIVRMALPTLEEQQRIIEIISAQDKVIALKGRLLEEKQRQKKYLMQQLLTGKKRLSGFSGEWKRTPIGSFIHEIDERSTENNQYDILSVTKNGIVRQSEHFNKQIASEDNTGYKILRRGNLAFSSMNLWMGSLDVLDKYDIGIISPAYKVFSFNTNRMDIGFGKQFMRSEPMIWQYKVNSEQGASVVRRNLDIKALLGTRVRIPELAEQKAIAAVLSMSDKEIELICQDLEQEKQKKKALMQLLLTGIVRV